MIALVGVSDLRCVGSAEENLVERRTCDFFGKESFISDVLSEHQVIIILGKMRFLMDYYT